MPQRNQQPRMEPSSRRMLTRRHLTIAAAALGLFVLSQYGCARLVNDSAMRKFMAAQAAEPFDAIIVPGAPFKPEANDGHWSRIVKARVYWSYYLYTLGLAKNVIYSGAAVHSPYVEARIMALYGAALGIPAEHIIVEPTAEHSTENVYYSYRLAKKLGFARVALATDPYQSRMLQRFVAKQGLALSFVPVAFDILAGIEQLDPPISADQAYVPGFVALKDRQGFFERLAGTAGKHIRYEPQAAAAVTQDSETAVGAMLTPSPAP